MIAAIDAHHHLWSYDPAEYAWIGEHMGKLRRDFLPPDLEREMQAAGVAGAVAVQARQSLRETEWLLELARQTPFLLGVVGWAPLASPSAAAELERLSCFPQLKGVRHVAQDEPDGFLLRAGFQKGLALLRQFGLVYDILIYERQLGDAIALVDAFPEQVFVLDHVAKPRIRDGVLSPWRENIRRLAERENVYCKVSGMVTEAAWDAWSPAGLAPYWETVLEAFTPRRLMFGTDWPVLELAGSYSGWTAQVREWISKLSPNEQERVMRGTAVAAYRLAP